MDVVRLLCISAICVACVGRTSAQAQVAAPPRSTEVADPSTEESPSSESPANTPWGWVQLPKVTLPKVTLPKVEMPKIPADPFAPVKTSARKVSDGAKKAWEGTKEIFTFGGQSTDQEPPLRVAEKQPSMWQKMFSKEEAAPEGPQTVAEWMAQPRLDP